jgi:glycolate oxidase iron-sulfur subunit
MKRDILELTTHCIRCGFCLEDCPTFAQTGNELESPRGRIYLVRSAIEGKLDWQDDVKPHLDLCLGCRACETACPSGVEYGAILEMARDKLESEKPNIFHKLLLAGTTQQTILRTQLGLSKLLPGKRMPAFVSRLMSGNDPQVDLPKLQRRVDFPLVESLPIRGSVYMLTGCAMNVLYLRVHQVTERLLNRIGYSVINVIQGCCGALHAHNGDLSTAEQLANNLINQLKGDYPVIVNSAGCGSTMKEYGHLISDQKDNDFSKRVFDVSEFLYDNGLAELLAKAPGFEETITYHDACHLSHGQKITNHPRELLKAIPNSSFIELKESLMCCGSAGIYNVVQPNMARELLDRKVGHVQDSNADIVATGNPGCHAWIAQGCSEVKGAKVMHTAEVLEAAFIGLEVFK